MMLLVGSIENWVASSQDVILPEDYQSRSLNGAELELENKIIRGRLGEFLFSEIIEASLAVTNTTFLDVGLACKIEFSLITFKNVVFDERVSDFVSSSQIAAHGSQFSELFSRMVDTQVAIEGSAFELLATTIISEYNRYTSEIKLTGAKFGQVASDIVISLLEVDDCYATSLVDDSEGSKLLIKNITFLGPEALIGVLDMRSVLVIEGTLVPPQAELVHSALASSCVLLSNCSFDGSRRGALFYNMVDGCELHVLDCVFSGVGAPAALLIDNARDVQLISVQFSAFHDIRARWLISERLINVHNVSLYRTGLDDTPSLADAASAFFVMLQESIATCALWQPLFCAACENGAIFIGKSKLLLRGSEDAPALMGSTFDMQLQLKLARLEVSGARSGLSRDLVGHLLIESSYIVVADALNGLVDEMYASGVIFDTILIVNAREAVLFGNKTTSSKVYMEDVQLFDAATSRCSGVGRRRIEVLLLNYTCGLCDDFPEWFRGYDFDYLAQRQAHQIYNEDALHWVFQYCYSTDDRVTSGKCLVGENVYREFVLYDSLLEEQYEQNE